jgi:hypothetical protein
MGMNTLFRWTLAAAALAAAGALAPEGRAGLPQPSCMFYGLASDEYGWPYTTNATVTLWVNDRQFASQEILGLTAPGVNFTFRLPLDSGAGELYDPKAARFGDLVSITLSAFGQQKPIMAPMLMPKVGRPGQILKVNVTAGTDSDGDGMPDEWQRWIVERSKNPDIQTISDVHPYADADGDGMSNLDEYLAGTDPASAQDCFYIEQWERLENGRFHLQFLTVPGKGYQVSAADLRAGPPYAWQPCSFASSPSGSLQLGSIMGTGHYVSIFVEGSGRPMIYRLVVK